MMDDWHEELVEQVREAMQERGHTQHDVAVAIGAYDAQVSDWLRGRCAPARENEKKIRAYVRGDTDIREGG